MRITSDEFGQLMIVAWEGLQATSWHWFGYRLAIGGKEKHQPHYEQQMQKLGDVQDMVFWLPRRGR